MALPMMSITVILEGMGSRPRWLNRPSLIVQRHDPVHYGRDFAPEVVGRQHIGLAFSLALLVNLSHTRILL